MSLYNINYLMADHAIDIVAVGSAMSRAPQSVLHAVYKSLLDTKHCGGASQHAVNAEEIKKEGECV